MGLHLSLAMPTGSISFIKKQTNKQTLKDQNHHGRIGSGLTQVIQEAASFGPPGFTVCI